MNVNGKPRFLQILSTLISCAVGEDVTVGRSAAGTSTPRVQWCINSVSKTDTPHVRWRVLAAFVLQIRLSCGNMEHV